MTDLFENRHVLAYMKASNALMIEGVSEQNVDFLEAYCSLNSIEISDLLKHLIGEFISQQNTPKLLTQMSLGLNLVNSSQVSGLQAFTDVNGPVNIPVNGRLQVLTEKSVPFVNKQIMLENMLNSVKKEMLATQLHENAKNVIGYAVHNSGFMNRALDADMLCQILYKDFTPEQIGNFSTL